MSPSGRSRARGNGSIAWTSARPVPGRTWRRLSGGNQQKVALARLLHHDVDVLVLDEPTRGIDVASKAQIYKLIDELVSGPRTQKAVLIVSSYFPELLALCDRIAVMSRGHLGEPRPAAEWTEHALVLEASAAACRACRSASGSTLGERSVTRFQDAGVLAGLALVALLFGFLIGPQFFSAANLELMARQTAIVCVAALGMTMVIVAGGIDLSVGSVIALSTVVTAQLLRDGSWPLVAAAGAIAAGAVCGLMNGVLITGLRVVPFIITLGTMLLVRGGAKGLADERRLEAPLTWLNSMLRTVRDGSGLLLPWGIWIVILLAVMVAITLQYTRFGRHLFAIGSSERTARLCGVRVERCKIAVYAIAGAFAGLAGVMEFSRLSVGDPTVAIGAELGVIAAVIIGGGSLSGGKGTVVGTIAGAGIMTLIQIGCSQHGLPNWVQEIVTGTIIVFAVALDHFRSRSHLDENHRPLCSGSQVSHLEGSSRQRRRAHRPRLFGGVCHPRDGCRPGRARPDIYGRARQRGVRSRHRSVPASGRRPRSRRHHVGFRRVLAQPRGRIAAALAGARKRRHSSRARRRRQRRVGSLRESRREAGVEAARRHDAGATRVVHRLPSHHRCADAATKRWRFSSVRPRRSRRARPSS